MLVAFLITIPYPSYLLSRVCFKRVQWLKCPSYKKNTKRNVNSVPNKKKKYSTEFTYLPGPSQWFNYLSYKIKYKKNVSYFLIIKNNRTGSTQLTVSIT
jgi:hypothetical protein